MQGAQCLAAAMKETGSRLEVLCLDDNPLTAEGGNALAAGVWNSQSLRQLHLCNTGIGDAGTAVCYLTEAHVQVLSIIMHWSVLPPGVFQPALQALQFAQLYTKPCDGSMRHLGTCVWGLVFVSIENHQDSIHVFSILIARTFTFLVAALLNKDIIDLLSTPVCKTPLCKTSPHLVNYVAHFSGTNLMTPAEHM